MSEDKKEVSSPRQQPPAIAPTVAASKNQTPVSASATPGPQAVTAPPKPAASPPRVPPPMPPSRPQPAKTGRRGFLKFLLGVAAVLSVIPFVPWGDFLSSSVSTHGKITAAQKVVVDNDSKQWGPAAGKAVNVNDLNTFPPNSHWTITYPSSGNPTLDAQNPDTFQKWDLIRLPTGPLGGDQKSAAAFVAFNKVCVHLWCSPSYKPQQGHLDYECPCHGSIYEIPDGKAVQGPASLQPPPTNAIPMLTLTADSSGQLLVQPLVETVDKNGLRGYGRDFNSYQNYILPVAEGKQQPATS